MEKQLQFRDIQLDSYAKILEIGDGLSGDDLYGAWRRTVYELLVKLKVERLSKKETEMGIVKSNQEVEKLLAKLDQMNQLRAHTQRHMQAQTQLADERLHVE